MQIAVVPPGRWPGSKAANIVKMPHVFIPKITSRSNGGIGAPFVMKNMPLAKLKCFRKL